jgi:hypothetical protein
MEGKGRRRGGTYYACELNPRHHADKPWYAEHPKSVWVREDALTAAVHSFFATRILGPHRHENLDAELTAARGDTVDDTASRRANIRKQIDDLRRRQNKILDQLDGDEDDDLDPETRREFRQRLRGRFAETTTQIRKAEAECATLAAAPTGPRAGNADLLDHLPQIELCLPHAPIDLQRGLYDAFNLKIIYNRERHEATLEATVTADTLNSITHSIQQLTDSPTTTQVSTSHAVTAADEPQRPVSHALGAPNGIRTRATALKGRRPRPLDDGGRRSWWSVNARTWGLAHGAGGAWGQARWRPAPPRVRATSRQPSSRRAMPSPINMGTLRRQESAHSVRRVMGGG